MDIPAGFRDPAYVQDSMHDGANRVNPAARRSPIAIVGVGLLPDLNKGILQGVFGECRVAQNASASAKKPARFAGVQIFQGIGFSTRAGDESRSIILKTAVDRLSP